MLAPMRGAYSRQEIQLADIVRIRLVLRTYIWLTILIIKKAKNGDKNTNKRIITRKNGP